MKRIGIVTFHRALNNGAVLQAIALERAVSKLGAKAELVDYKCPKIENDYSIINFRQGLKKFILSLKMAPQVSKQRENFKKFYQEKMNISSKRYTKKNIKEANKYYDAFIAGSDQVWSPTCAGFDENYFLTFAEDKKKYSYAASLGQNRLPNDLIKEYRKRLDSFKKLSCREESACVELKNILDKPVYCHIDPVFLLDQSDWKELIGPAIIEEDYIFVFRVNVPVSLFVFAEQLSNKLNMKLVYSDGRKIYFNKKVHYIPGISPDIFLNLLSNASCVVTNSFHGVAFSAIFHKKIYVELNSTAGRNTRAELLMKKLRVPYTEILGDSDVIEHDMVGWESIECNIEKERHKALAYLAEIIGEKDEIKENNV